LIINYLTLFLTKYCVHNIDFIPAGIQYAFLSDWSKIRPVLQSSIGLRVSLTAKANYHGSSNNDVLEQFLDIPWSVGGGAAIGKHFTVIGSYGGGFITAIQSDTDWKNRQFQLSVTIF
jgi:hypothetical protein